MTGGLKAWDNPSVVRATAASDIDFASFRRKPQTLYLSVSEDHIPTLAPLLRLLFVDLIRALRAHEPGPDEPWPVMILIDEFQQMGAMPYLERAIHTLASYGGRVAMIAQSLAALDDIYGPRGRTSLETGAGIKLYIAPRDQTTVAELSTAVGQTTAEAVTQSYGMSRGLFGPRGTTSRLEARPLLSETSARTMDPDEVILLAAPHHPVKAQRIRYYEDATFQALHKAQDGIALPYPPRLAPESEASTEPPINGLKARRTTRRRTAQSAKPSTLRPLDLRDRKAALPQEVAERLRKASTAARRAVGLQAWDISGRAAV